MPRMPTALLIGNSDGIGLALTEMLLAEGWQVGGVSRSESRLFGTAYAHHVIDVCHPGYSARLSELLAALGPLDVVVYCAGIGELLELDTLSSERRVFEVNLLGAVTTATVVIPHLLRAGRGHFIGLSSQADSIIDARAPSYAASKAGLSSYLEGLAFACRPRGVFVTNLRFGFVDTKMAKARVRPFMISREAAARRVRHCMRVRPLRDTYPKRIAPLLWALGLGTGVRRWFS